MITDAPPVRTFKAHPADHRFFNVMSIVTAITIVAGFANTYGPKVASGQPGLPAIIHLHALVFGTWLVLIVVQTSLVSAGRVQLHRSLGIAGVVLAGLMVVVGMATAVTSARLGHRGIPGVEFPDVEGFFLLNLMATLVFGILVAGGWYFRRNPQAHKRLMLLSTTGALIGPGVSRLPVVSGNTPLIGVLVLAFVLSGPLYDLVTRRRIHPVYLFGVPLTMAAIPPVVAQIAATPAWHAMAGLFLR